MASDAAFIPIDTDPPRLQRYRSVILPWFCRPLPKKAEQGFSKIASALIDVFIEDGTGRPYRSADNASARHLDARTVGFR